MMTIGQEGPTYWSEMTDGRSTACAGVEVYTAEEANLAKPSGASKYESIGWFWGPCA